MHFQIYKKQKEKRGLNIKTASKLHKLIQAVFKPINKNKKDNIVININNNNNFNYNNKS